MKVHISIYCFKFVVTVEMVRAVVMILIVEMPYVIVVNMISMYVYIMLKFNYVLFNNEVNCKYKLLKNNKYLFSF